VILPFKIFRRNAKIPPRDLHLHCNSCSVSYRLAHPRVPNSHGARQVMKVSEAERRSRKRPPLFSLPWEREMFLYCNNKKQGDEKWHWTLPSVSGSQEQEVGGPATWEHKPDPVKAALWTPVHGRCADLQPSFFPRVQKKQERWICMQNPQFLHVE
jgi:hypothetical protein